MKSYGSLRHVVCHVGCSIDVHVSLRVCVRDLEEHLDPAYTGGGSGGPIVSLTLCYAMVLPGRKSAFQAGFQPESNWESLTIGPPAGLRPAEADFEAFPNRIQPKSYPEDRFPIG